MKGKSMAMPLFITLLMNILPIEGMVTANVSAVDLVSCAADAYVLDSNYGTVSLVVVKGANGGEYCKKSIFKFDLSSLSGTSAPMPMQGYSILNDSWGKSVVTWNNIPVANNKALDSKTVSSTTPVLQAQDDFEDGDWDYSNEPQIGNSDSLTVVMPLFGSADGTKAIKFEWERQYYDDSVRSTKSAEICTGRANWLTDVWEEFYYYFPSDDFANEPHEQIIKQWIAWHPSIPTCNKTFALSISNGVLKASRLYGTDMQAPYHEDYKLLGDIPKDQWVKFNLHLKFDCTGSKGLIQIWINSTNYLDVREVKMGIGVDAYGPYAKYGPYVYGSSDYDVRLFYADGIKWGYDQIYP